MTSAIVLTWTSALNCFFLWACVSMLKLTLVQPDPVKCSGIPGSCYWLEYTQDLLHCVFKEKGKQKLNNLFMLTKRIIWTASSTMQKCSGQKISQGYKACCTISLKKCVFFPLASFLKRNCEVYQGNTLLLLFLRRVNINRDWTEPQALSILITVHQRLQFD